MRRTLYLAFGLSLGACATGKTCPPVESTTPHANDPAKVVAEGDTSKPLPAPEVRSAEAAPKKTAPHGKATVALLAQGENAFLGKLEMVAGASVPEHQDPTEEYIHVLSGHGTLVMNGQRYEIGPGMTIFMPAFATVSYQNGDEPFVGIQVFAGPGPAQKYDAWK